MAIYRRSIQYYETDMMGVTHHGNYIRLMEEARIAFLDELDYSYLRLEREGIISPVTAINCRYLASTTFGDEITVETHIESFNGVVLKMAYAMRKQDGTLAMTGTSEHTFLDRQGHFIRLKRDYPEFYQLLMSQIQAVEPQ